MWQLSCVFVIYVGVGTVLCTLSGWRFSLCGPLWDQVSWFCCFFFFFGVFELSGSFNPSSAPSTAFPKFLLMHGCASLHLFSLAVAKASQMTVMLDCCLQGYQNAINSIGLELSLTACITFNYTGLLQLCWVFWFFPMKFRIALSSSVKNHVGMLMGIALNM